MGDRYIDVLVELYRERFHELLAGALVISVALIPFFGVKELGRVLGEEKVRALFFRSRGAQSSPPGR